VYAISGYSPISGDTRRVDRLDPHTLRWSQTTRIPTARRYLAAVTDNGRIYAIGGYNPQAGAVSSAGAYNTTTRRWSTIAPLPIPTAGAAATVGNDGRIYVFGGWDEAHGILHRTQIYNPTTNTWTLGADMPIHRETAAAATASNGCIYVLGGDTIQAGSPTALSEVDVYQPTTNTWTTAPPMLHARSSFAAATGTTDIYAIAGWNHGALASVERFPPLTTNC
jgi:N-acetylneuraminic acid mutarotase